MGAIRESFDTADAAGTLWLEVTIGTARRVFELAASDDRAIVVGSASVADVSIPAHGVAPIHFHFERVDDGVCVIPDASNDLRLDTVRVCGSRRIVDRGRIDVAGSDLLVRVLRRPPAAAEIATWTTGAPLGTDYLDALPTDIAETTAFDTLVLRRSVPESPTSRASMYSSKPAEPHYGPFGTEIVSRADVGSDAEQPTASTSGILAESRATLSRIPVHETVSISPRATLPTVGALDRASTESMAAFASTGETTAFELPAVSGHIHGFEHHSAPACAHGPSLAKLDTSAAPRKHGESSRREPRLRSLMAKIGVRAKDNPVTVGAVTVGTGVILALMLASGVRALHHSSPVRVSPGAAASARSLHPEPSPEASGSSVVEGPTPRTVATLPASAASTASSGTASSAAVVNSDPDTAAAVAHLVAGRIVEAQHAYAALTDRYGNDRALAGVSKLLARAGEARCLSSTQAPRSCPEVKR